MPVDLVILGLGFTGPTRGKLLQDLGVQWNEKGLVRTDTGHQTSTARVFCAGDMELGASLVVRVIATGQDAADSIHRLLSQE